MSNEATTAKPSPLDKLGLRLNGNLDSLKRHGRLLSSDLDNLEINLTLLHQAVVLQQVELWHVKQRLLGLEGTTES